MAWRNNKYGAQKTVLNGITFDSKREAARYQELKLMESAGAIIDLELQPEYILQDKFRHKGKAERAIVYRADFSYTDLETGERVVEDVKGMETKEFKIKRKMFLKKFGDDLDFRIIK